MPLILICGQPCSGKSGVAAQLAELLRGKGLEVVVVDEDSLHLDRNDSYKDGPSEKNMRSLLKATADRNLASKKRMVLLDSLNNIKGYRYELWCAARAAATRYCLVHVDTAVETCMTWNAERAGPKYEGHVMDDLCGRFERPDSRNRWDSPLFTIHPLLGGEHVQRELEAVVAAMTVDPSAGGGGEAAALRRERGPAAKELVPNIATNTEPTMLSATNLLYEIDKATQAVVERVTDAQAAAGAGPIGWVSFEDEGLQPLLVQRQVTLPELRRHKRAFMRLATNLTFNRLSDALAARRMFIDYLREQLAQS